MLADLHFLRPWWLTALPLAAALWLYLARLGDSTRAWRGIIDPHLLDALLVRSVDAPRVRPLHVLGASWVVASLVLAGPTWQRAPVPFANDSAALGIVVEASESMGSKDLAPSRIARAGHKVRDLLAERSDVDTALFAYAGSAHRVLPLSSDAALIATFADALAPEIMPSGGDARGPDDALDEALRLTNAELARAGRAGSIVLLSDGVTPRALAAARETASVPVHVLGMATEVGARTADAVGAPPPDFDSLKDLARATGGTFVTVTPGPEDVQRLAKIAERQIGTVAARGEEEQWRDGGYWGIPIVALLVLGWSRRGWAITVHGGAR